MDVALPAISKEGSDAEVSLQKKKIDLISFFLSSQHGFTEYLLPL